MGSIFQIERMVQAIGIQPRFCLTPKVVEFKKKTISNMDQRVSSYSYLTLMNPNAEPLAWLIDTRDLLQEQILDLSPNERACSGRTRRYP